MRFIPRRLRRFPGIPQPAPPAGVTILEGRERKNEFRMFRRLIVMLTIAVALYPMCGDGS